MNSVRPKKHLGQHFLKDQNIAEKIVDTLSYHTGYKTVVEIGPGTGVLTEFLVDKKAIDLWLVEIDRESVKYLNQHYPALSNRILETDFLKHDLKENFQGDYGIIGNFPYNISSQIFFKVLEEKDKVKEVVCMLQREVALRLASGPGNKTYGILSVLLQAFYDIKYIFTVDEYVFIPPPKVKSGVIQLKRNQVDKLGCDEKMFFRVVKQGFQNRRKTLRNALKPLGLKEEILKEPVLDKRAEQLSVAEFIELTKLVMG